MKTSKFYLFILLFLIGQIMVTSCTISERTAIACPEFKIKKPHQSIDFNNYKQSQIRKRSFEKTGPLFTFEEQKTMYEFKLIQVKDIKLEGATEENGLSSMFVNASLVNFHPLTYKKEKAGMDLIIKNKNFPLIEDDIIDPDSCDLIVLLNGEEIRAKQIAIGPDSIKYLLCDSLNASPLLIHTLEVSMIKFASGKIEVISDKSNTSLFPKKKKIEPYSVVGFVLSFLGFWEFAYGIGIVGVGIILPVGLIFFILFAGLIFSLIGFFRVMLHRDKYVGLGFAILGILLISLPFIFWFIYYGILGFD